MAPLGVTLDGCTTERITMLVITVDAEPAMIVSRLERPDAEAAAGASILRITDWTDPYTESATLMAGTGRYAVFDSAWAMRGPGTGLLLRFP